MSVQPRQFSDAEIVTDTIIEKLNGRVVLALPLGLGKANLIANAFYRRAARDPEISLTILTALSLETPRGSSTLQQRFIDPINQRIFAGYPELAYTRALRKGDLPSNIQVHEFFLPAGHWLGTPAVQQGFILSNYTHAVRTLIDHGVNVIAQMVARDGDRISLSSNADLTPDLIQARRAGKTDFLLLGEVNNALPFMHADAELSTSDFDCLLEGPQCSYPLFAPPKPAVAMADYAAGFHIASLVADGGTIQIGIGSIGDAVAQALILRQNQNRIFRDTITRLSENTPATASLIHDGPFIDGLFGLSEMLVDSFLPMIDAGVVKREIDGALIQSAFFLGPRAFYERLHDMTQEQRRKIHMKPVSWVNSLYHDEKQKRADRVHARFINNAMMATLMGAVVSDGLEDGRVVSGVGGQYDFVAQAHALEGARSVIALNATRMSGGKVYSNILWSYANQTIPRHLRDIVVTEYGVADIRNRTDSEVIAAMLAISDSRFQAGLLDQAKHAGKIDAHYEIPAGFKNNTPLKVAALLEATKKAGYLPAYPFGSDFTPTEQQLIPALTELKNGASSPLHLAGLVVRGMRVKPAQHSDCLQRLGLGRPQSPADWVYRFLVLYALDKTAC